MNMIPTLTTILQSNTQTTAVSLVSPELYLGAFVWLALGVYLAWLDDRIPRRFAGLFSLVAMATFLVHNVVVTDPIGVTRANRLLLSMVGSTLFTLTPIAFTIWLMRTYPQSTDSNTNDSSTTNSD